MEEARRKAAASGEATAIRSWCDGQGVSVMISLAGAVPSEPNVPTQTS